MKRQLVYFIVFIYSMVTLIAVGKKKNTATVSKTSKSSFETIIKKSTTIHAQKFHGSNSNFAFRFSNNEFSFLY